VRGYDLSVNLPPHPIPLPDGARERTEYAALTCTNYHALIARVEARETLPRQDAPAPLSRRYVPANVAVAEFPLQNDAKSVTEKVEVGRVVWKSRVDDVDGIGMDIVLQTRSRFLAAAAAQCQKCQKRCSYAAHRSAFP